jgi:hypothetical protein
MGRFPMRTFDPATNRAARQASSRNVHTHSTLPYSSAFDRPDLTNAPARRKTDNNIDRVSLPVNVFC